MGKIVLGMILGVGALIVGIAVIGIVASNSHPANGSNSAGTDSSAPAITVVAPKLWADYHANEVAADDVYKGKRLIVSGMVTSINKDFADDVYVLLSTFNQFESVHADIRSEYQQEAASLEIGQLLTVDCQGGGMVVGSPVLRNCSILPNAPAEQSTPESQEQSEPEPQPAPQADSAPQVPTGQAVPVASNQPEESSSTSDSVTPPVLIYQAPVNYPTEARNQKYQGIVQVVLLVDENGIPQNVTVVHPLGMGLDEAAVEAVKQYKFKPAVDQTGKNVPAQISLNIQFHLE